MGSKNRVTHSKTHARKWTEIFPLPEKRTESKSQSDPFQTVENLVAEKTKSYEFSFAQKIIFRGTLDLHWSHIVYDKLSFLCHQFSFRFSF